MTKAFAFILAALALSVFVVGCAQQSEIEATAPVDGVTPSTATPEAQADASAGQAVMEPEDDVEIGELV